MVELKEIPVPIQEKDERLKENTQYLIKIIVNDKPLTRQLETVLFHKGQEGKWLLTSTYEGLGIKDIHELYEIVETEGKPTADEVLKDVLSDLDGVVGFDDADLEGLANANNRIKKYFGSK